MVTILNGAMEHFYHHRSAWELAKISDRRPLNCTQIEHTKVNCIYFKVSKVLIGKSILQYEAI